MPHHPERSATVAGSERYAHPRPEESRTGCVKRQSRGLAMRLKPSSRPERTECPTPARSRERPLPAYETSLKLFLTPLPPFRPHIRLVFPHHAERLDANTQSAWSLHTAFKERLRPPLAWRRLSQRLVRPIWGFHSHFGWFRVLRGLVPCLGKQKADLAPTPE